jgi:hypothetical protein
MWRRNHYGLAARRIMTSRTPPRFLHIHAIFATSNAITDYFDDDFRINHYCNGGGGGRLRNDDSSSRACFGGAWGHSAKMTFLWKFYVIFVPERHFCGVSLSFRTPSRSRLKQNDQR